MLSKKNLSTDIYACKTGNHYELTLDIVDNKLRFKFNMKDFGINNHIIGQGSDGGFIFSPIFPQTDILELI